MAFGRDRFGRFAHRIQTARIPPPQQFKRFGVRVGRIGARMTARGVSSASRRAIGLTPSEYQELRRLREMKRRGVFRGDEKYLLEPRRLKELETRFQGEERKQQFYRFAKKATPGPVKSYIKRLKA